MITDSETKRNNLPALLIILFLAGLAFAFYGQKTHWRIFSKPCKEPITYSLGSFDNHFGISQKDFLADIESASKVWEKTINRDLFKYSAQGSLKVNLVYDARQQATERLKSLGYNIENNKGSYNSLKSEYDSLTIQYQQLKTELENLIAQYQKQLQAYEAQVQYWNGRGGAPPAEYNKLKAQQDNLDAQTSLVNQKRDQLNQIVANINALASVLNTMASQLNLNVSQYNTIGQSRGEEFEEGVYISDSSGTRIDIYEFNDQHQLVRVLAHELGHALGLDHVEDTDAIMYRLNSSQNETPTTSDIVELKQLCGIN